LLVIVMMGAFFVLGGCQSQVECSGKPADIDGDTSIDGDMDEDVDEELTGNVVSVSKWIQAHNSVLHVADTGNGNAIVWSASKAGLLGLDNKGTVEDQSDDETLMHHEFTLENWPTEDIVGLCSGVGSTLWIATKNALYLFDPKDTPFDASDDELTKGETDVFSSERTIVNLGCDPEKEEAIVSTSAGFVMVNSGDTLADASSWTWLDYQNEGQKRSGSRVETEAADVLSSRPYHTDIDSDGRLWVITYTDSYRIYVMELGDIMAADDDSLNEIALDDVSPISPTSITADSNIGAWIVNNGQAYHVSYNLVGESVWTLLDLGTTAPVERFMAIADGVAVAVVAGSVDKILVDTKSTDDVTDYVVLQMPGFGEMETNRITSVALQASTGIWYSTRHDFGLLKFGDDIAGQGWQPIRYHSLGSVSANDIGALVALDNHVYLAGTTGITKVAYATDTTVPEFVFSTYPVDNPEGLDPIELKSLIELDNGALAGGKYPAYLSAEGNVIPWDKRGGPKHVTLATSGPQKHLWVGTVHSALVSLFSFRAYDYRGTPEKAGDDSWEAISSDWFGAGVFASVDFMAFFDECKALIGNPVGLHYYDCNGTPMDASDDSTYGELLGTDNPVQKLEYAGNNGFWIKTMDGLGYFDMGGTPDTEDDQLVSYHVQGQSVDFAYDGFNRLYYFVEDGLMIHDINATPLDLTDDLAVLIEMRSDKKAILELDKHSGLWCSYGDGSGVYYVKIENLEFAPLEELLP